MDVSYLHPGGGTNHNDVFLCVRMAPALLPDTSPDIDIVPLRKDVHPAGEIPQNVVRQHVAPEEGDVVATVHGFFPNPNLVILCDKECRTKGMKPTLMTDHQQRVIPGPVIICITQETDDGAIFRGLTADEYREAAKQIRPLNWRE